MLENRSVRYFVPAQLSAGQDTTVPGDMIWPAASIRTGTLKPKASMLRAMRRTWLRLWSRGLFGSGLSSEIFRYET